MPVTSFVGKIVYELSALLVTTADQLCSESDSILHTVKTWLTVVISQLEQIDMFIEMHV